MGRSGQGQRHILEGQRRQDAAEFPPPLRIPSHMVTFQGWTLVHLRCPQPSTCLSKHLLDEEMWFLPDFPFTVENTEAQRLRKQLKSVRQGQLPAWISQPAPDPPRSASTEGEARGGGNGFLI